MFHIHFHRPSAPCCCNSANNFHSFLLLSCLSWMILEKISLRTKGQQQHNTRNSSEQVQNNASFSSSSSAAFDFRSTREVCPFSHCCRCSLLLRLVVFGMLRNQIKTFHRGICFPFSFLSKHFPTTVTTNYRREKKLKAIAFDKYARFFFLLVLRTSSTCKNIFPCSSFVAPRKQQRQSTHLS